MQSWLCLSVAVITLTLLQNYANAAQALERVDPHPDHPGKCYDKESNKAYALAESWNSPTGCIRHTCSGPGKDNKYYLITTVSCGAIGASPPCTVVDGPSNASYPDCCPTIKCPENH